jgi:hypothetical protein
VGAVVASGNDARIDSLEQVTPPALNVSDVAWSNSTTLMMIARNTLVANADSGVWSVQSDGSFLLEQGVDGLPGSPQTITAAPGQFAIVNVADTLWIQRSISWVSLDGSGSTSGTNPIYAPPP